MIAAKPKNTGLPDKKGGCILSLWKNEQSQRMTNEDE